MAADPMLRLRHSHVPPIIYRCLLPIMVAKLPIVNGVKHSLILRRQATH